MIRHGFVNSDEKWKKDGLMVDIKKKKIVNSNGSKCVFGMNEGYFSSYGIQKLYNYTPMGDIEESGLELARLFIETGIAIPHEIFVEYYDKL